MAYKVKLKLEGSDYVWDEREANDDEELFAILGKFSLWYFLALDSCDYRDAYPNGNEPEDALLAFTCDKWTDGPDTPHRHGLPTGMLAYGHAWPQGLKQKAWVYVERQ